MRHCPLHKLRAVSHLRKAGYLDDVLKSAVRVTETHAILTDDEFRRIHVEYALPPGHGPGTELKSLLKTIGIAASPGCSCNKRAQAMDRHGPDWCEEHIDEISGWLEEEARKRNLPYVHAAGKMLIRLAIRRARKKGNKK